MIQKATTERETAPGREPTPGPTRFDNDSPARHIEKLNTHFRDFFVDLGDIADVYGPARPNRNSLLLSKYDVFIMTLRACHVAYYSLRVGLDAYELADRATVEDSIYLATGDHLAHSVNSIGHILRLMAAMPRATIETWFHAPPSVHVPMGLFVRCVFLFF